MRWPLRRQILLPLVAVAIVSLAAVAAINAQLAARQTQERIERRLRGVTSVLAMSNFPLTDNVLRQMRDLSGAEFVVTDEAGASQTSSLEQQPPRLPVAGVTTSEASPLGLQVELNGARYFHQAARLPARAGDSPAGWLHVLFPETEYDRAWRDAFVPPIAIGALTVLAVAAVTSLITGRLSGAMRQLGDDVLRIARGDFSPTHVPRRDDEIRDLSLAVNRTAELLKQYSDQVRQTEQMRTVALLGAGLAHEMRNATTGCRIALDLHAEHCDHDGESLSVAKRQLQLMESQLQRFMRAGKHPVIADARELDLAKLVEDLLPLVGPAARHAGVELRWASGEVKAPIVGDREALGQAVMNVLLNAIEAVQQQSAGKRVVDAVLRRSRPGFAELVISDSGAGPRQDVADKVFAPFVTSKPEGVGLGLAVVKGIVEAHHGAIDWIRSEGATRFRIEIPLAMKGSSCV